jgi:hypothetical protein
MVGVGDSSVCVKCHKAGDAGYRAAAEIHNQVSTLASMYRQAEDELQDIRTKGMNDADIAYLLQEGKQQLIQLRTLIHTFDVEKIKNQSAGGKKLIDEAMNQERLEIKEYNWRRMGFGISTLAFVILIIALILKIRQKKPGPGGTQAAGR